jgi:integrase
MKYYRRFIRINGELHTSPRFNKKSDAETWYHEKRKKKQFLRDGIIIDEKDDSLRFIDYARTWLEKRMTEYPQSTWKGDEQRLRDYILPLMSEISITSITTSQVRSLLMKISEPGFLESEKPTFQISTSTRTRVKALLSVMFSDALNEDPPIVSINPVLGIKFKERRKGTKKPRHLGSADECLKFLSAAKEIGSIHFLVGSIFLMSGVRKQELIAMKWKSFDARNQTLSLSEKYEQTSNSIKSGTKAGEDVSRKVPISSQLADVLKEYKKTTKHKGPDDFIVARADGRYFGARDINRIIETVREKAKLDISPHGLRHTFGREFVLNTGNLKALQAILGHASSKTTDIYSDLTDDRLKGFHEAVTFQKGVKERDE